MKFIFKTNEEWSGLILRIVLGVVIISHGSQKLLGWFGGFGFTGTMGFFTQQLHIPYPLALLVIIAEFFGSVGLIVGLLSRIAAFGIGCVMAGGIWLIHWQNGFFMNWFGKQPGEGIEYSLLVLAISVALIIAGSGKWSLDRYIAARLSD